MMMNTKYETCRDFHGLTLERLPVLACRYYSLKAFRIKDVVEYLEFVAE